jgi:iron complex outermembrane receptor protein
MTWRASLNWRPGTDALIFANYATGFKSGGFNSGGSVPALGQRRRFDNEIVENYELGAKTSWLGGSLVVNATAFSMDIEGFQDRAFDGLSFVLRNAGKLRQQGVEFDALLWPGSAFSVNAALAYLDSAFTDYRSAAGLPGLGGTQDITGTPNAFSPEWQGTIGANISGDIDGPGLRWSLTPSVSLISEHFQGINDANGQTIQGGYVTAQARLAISSADDLWTIAIFGNNLTDARFCQAKFYQTLGAGLGLNNGVFPGSTAVRCQLADPRSIGASVKVRF